MTISSPCFSAAAGAEMHDLHVANGWLAIVLNAAVGLWCLAAFRWPTVGGRPMWVAVVIAQLVAMALAITGAFYAQQAGTELHDMHALYGFTVVIAVGIAYSYRSSGFMKGKETLLYAGASLFIMGLGLRNLYL